MGQATATIMEKTKISLSIVFIFLFANSFAQQWTEPVNISNLANSHNQSPKICIDSFGVIHCVWRGMEPGQPSLSRIYYSKSINYGYSWDGPDIVNNIEEKVTVSEPNIAVNSEGNIAIAYTKGGDNTSSFICLAHICNSKWLEDTVSKGMPGSIRPLITYDNNGVLNCFWFHFGPYGNTYFMRIDNDFNLSQVECLLCNEDMNAVQGNVVYDKNNWLHFISLSNPYLHQIEDTRAVYYVRNKDACEPQKIFGSTQCAKGFIELDTEGNPVASWMEKDTDISWSYNCYSSKSTDNIWDTSVLISDSIRGFSTIIDSDNKDHYFVSHITKDRNYSLLCHITKVNGNWQKIFIADSEASYIIMDSKYYNNFLYVVYQKYEFNADSSEKYSNIIFQKTDLISSCGDEKPPKGEINIYPNPFRGKLHINGFFGMGGTTQLEIFTYDGILVFSDQLETTEEGAFNYSWNGETSSGTKLQEGIYLLRLSSGESVVCKTIISIN